MNKQTIISIIRFLWTLFLFGLWVMLSHSKGMNGEWWSMYRMNSVLALNISNIKVVSAVSLSMISAYFLAKWTGREEKTQWSYRIHLIRSP